MQKHPIVSIIIVNYNGKRFLKSCLDSLRQLHFPKSQFEIIVVDNNSWDDSVAYLKREYPEVHIIESEHNVGFAGGNNLGVKHAHGRYVVLLNNDTTVDPDWLSALVHRAESSRSIGAVNGKSLLWYPFIELRIVSDVFTKSEFTQTADFQQVGVLVEHVEIEDRSLQHLVQYRSGFYEKEKGTIVARWTNGDGRLLIPFDPNGEKISLTMTLRSQKGRSGLRTPFVVMLGEVELEKHVLEPAQVKQYSITIPKTALHKHALYAVQNAGNAVFKNGYVRDLGVTAKHHMQRYEIDNPYYAVDRKIIAFCGVNVLLKKDVFLSLGGFDESFFMYYEDIDLSLRMWRMGYDIVYEPKAIVHHIHSASSGEWSSFVQYHAERNHLALVIKQFPWIVVGKQLIMQCMAWLISYIRMMKWGIKGSWVKFELWEERQKFRLEVLRWIFVHMFELLHKRRILGRQEKRSIQSLHTSLY